MLELVIFLGSVMVLLSSLASTYAAGRYYARIVLYTIAVFVVSVLALPLAIVMAVIGRKYDTNGLVSAIFYNLIVWLMGIEVEVEGAEYLQTNPAVYVANHQSAFDIFFIARYAEVSFCLIVLVGRWLKINLVVASGPNAAQSRVKSLYNGSLGWANG